MCWWAYLLSVGANDSDLVVCRPIAPQCPQLLDITLHLLNLCKPLWRWSGKVIKQVLVGEVEYKYKTYIFTVPSESLCILWEPRNCLINRTPSVPHHLRWTMKDYCPPAYPSPEAIHANVIYSRSAYEIYSHTDVVFSDVRHTDYSSIVIICRSHLKSVKYEWKGLAREAERHVSGLHLPWSPDDRTTAAFLWR